MTPLLSLADAELAQSDRPTAADWVKTKNPGSAAARRLAEEDWTR